MEGMGRKGLEIRRGKGREGKDATGQGKMERKKRRNGKDREAKGREGAAGGREVRKRGGRARLGYLSSPSPPFLVPSYSTVAHTAIHDVTASVTSPIFRENSAQTG